MNHHDSADRQDDLASALADQDLDKLVRILDSMTTGETIVILERLNLKQRALIYRLLPKQRALEVFTGLDVTLQGDLVRGLQDNEVSEIFAELNPDDRVTLLEELPDSATPRLLQRLPSIEREVLAGALGYPRGSIGRRMSPKYVAVQPDLTARESLERVSDGLPSAETIYTLPVLDDEHKLIGIAKLRDLMQAAPDAPVAQLMHTAYSAQAGEVAETAARRCAELKLLALPVIDEDSRVVGILTVDDALRILEEADSEDQARIGGSEPLRRPYLSTPVRTVVRSRVVWLLVLALGATFTVQVLEVFEDTLETMVVLSVFIPLLIGTGGNTGNQAATTITRALALEDVRPRDVMRVLTREARVGLSLGLLLGSVGFLLTTWVYGLAIGIVIGLTLLSICTMAATIGGVMPLIARVMRADPAVFSNPFITTFVDAAGLIIYFFIAKAVLQL